MTAIVNTARSLTTSRVIAVVLAMTKRKMRRRRKKRGKTYGGKRVMKISFRPGVFPG
jgi:hypothetical protein